ncbi:MAG: mechanosensitive ion channel family protein [Acidobacteria bacterium]|nr:mechanosensitive ion channel family protein [Acidobacteriota bacterium]
MKVRQKLTGIGLLALLAAGAVGLYLTSRPVASASSNETASGLPGKSLSLNPHYLNAAVRLAVLSATPEERRAAQSALNDADRDLDLQYAYALQLAATEPIPETPKIRGIQERIDNIDKAMETRQTEVNRLKNLVQRVRGARRNILEQQLEVHQAELNLFHEALSDAKNTLDQSGGSLGGRLAKLKAEHTAVSKEHDAFKFPPLPGPTGSGSLLARWSRWKTIYREQFQIHQAQQQAYAAAAVLERQQETLKKRIATGEAQRKALEKHELTPQQLAALIAAPHTRPTPASKYKAHSSGATSARAAQEALGPSNSPNPAIVLIQRISSERVMARILNRRVQTMDDLGLAYAKWDTLAEASGRSALHGLIAGGVWIVLMMACAFFLDRLIEHFFAGLSLERKQKTTLQAVLRISVRIIIVIVILMIIFGKPSNLSTVLGLAGAGLAVALQDFILSFMGWFVLMGRHGIRVGDWVEINPNSFSGVRGEVIEITLFRTVLLETGNWNEPGHLTGRQVAFMNMYAVSGYYFNFSTSGQWLWDELEVTIPRSQNPYPLVEKIQAIVARATESHTQLAEREWQRVSSRYGTKSFSAQPAVNIKPTDNGVIAIVRYVTRADERTAMRYRLNHEIVKLFHNGEDLVPGVEVLSDTEAPAPDRQ